MNEPRITEYLPSERRLVADFQQLLWHGGVRRNAAYLDWKYQQNPYLDHRYLLLAWAGDELVGMVGAFGGCWEASSGDRLMLPCLADTVVAPAFLGGSLFVRMLDELIERLRADGVPWLLDFGDQPAGPIMLMKGWKAIGPWAVATARREGFALDHPVWTRPHHSCVRGSRSGLMILASQTMSPSLVAAITGLAAQRPRGCGVRHVHDAQYLTWRDRNPLARYFYLAAGSQELDGYLIAHRSLVDPDAKGRATPTTIIDCEASADDVWTDLLEAALALLPGSEVLMWARDLSSARFDALGLAGFDIRQPTGRLTRDRLLPNLIVCSTGIRPEPSFAELHTPSAWDLRAVCGRSWR